MTGRLLRVLDRLRPAASRPMRGEIKNDVFARAIERVAATEGVRTMLEIGSAAGDGSTTAFVRGMARNPSRPMLYCMEVMKDRFATLSGRYARNQQVKCYNVASVGMEDFPREEEVAGFYAAIVTNLKTTKVEVVLGWLRQNQEYIRTHDIPAHGIRTIRQENSIETFDAVLIDGSEFTGRPELREVYGARFILLDDTNAFKNHNTCLQLLADPGYKLIESNTKLRNGYAVFERVPRG